MRLYDFRKFRTREHMEVAMCVILDATESRKGKRWRAKCPRPQCKGKSERALFWCVDWPVAYCMGCKASIDALDLTRHEKGVDYNEAARILESFVPVG